MAVRIAVNGRFQGRRITGVDRYASEILRRLEGQVRIVSPAHALAGLSGHLWEQFILPAHLSQGELLWSPANSGPITVPNQVVTIHDLTPLEHPEWFVPAYSLLYRFLFPALAHLSKCVITPSDFIQRKVIRYFSLPADRVVRVYEGVDAQNFRRIDPGAVRAKYGLAERYVLFIGSLQARKNLSTLVEAWDLIQAEFPKTQLVVAGAPGRVFRPMELPPPSPRIRFLGYVPEDDLPGLYSGAAVHALPSLEEGFGLTMLEAMACGTPVIASQSGALAEVAGDAALQVDPRSAHQIADGLRRLLTDETLRAGLIKEGLQRASQFPWERSAEGIRQVLLRYA